MLFCSREFLYLFSVVFAVYWTLDRRAARIAAFLAAATFLGYLALVPEQAGLIWKIGLALGVCVSAAQVRYLGVHQARVWLLLLVSISFYASWNHWLALLIVATTFMDYWVGRGLVTITVPRRRLVLLLLSLAVNLGILVYLKYANFFLDTLLQRDPASAPLLQVILPIGISFYTFEAINYTVDVYRRKVPAERDLAHFMLFILFFPHLVAGPIVRARDFLPQIRRRKRFDWMRLELGAQYFLMGLFKKLAIADRMAQFVDPVFNDPTQYKSFAVWIAVLAYAIQIYCDFSGYTDMALGCAHALGYKLTLNFNMPYVAANVSEFWRRWHMSLSGWLRDYLFIPLGGSRGTRRQTDRNLLITMTLGGLWHGANWTFVVWGMLHGLYLIGHRSFQDFVKPRPRLDAALRSAPGTALRIGLTFLTVCLTWVFFRAQTFGAAAEVLKRLFVPHAGIGPPIHDLGVWLTVAVVVLCHALAFRGLWRRLEPRLPDALRGLGYAAVLTLALVLAPLSGKAFIYFQF